MKSLRNRSSGFTIIELLIVIVVIAILAGLVLNAFGNIQARARDTERRNDINAIHTQLELFYTDNSAYPDALSELTNLNAEALVAPNDGEDYTYTPADDGSEGEAIPFTQMGDHVGRARTHFLNGCLIDTHEITHGRSSSFRRVHKDDGRGIAVWKCVVAVWLW